MSVLLAILLSVSLSAPFVEAEAQMLGAPSARTIDVTVEVEGAPTAVLARVTGLAGELAPVAMVPRGNGRYGQAIKLTSWEDVQVAFEYIDADGTTAISASSSLTDLGIDPEVIAPTRPETAPASGGFSVDPWLLAALAAALAAIVLMAFWSSGGLGDSMKPDDWTYASAEGLEEDASDPETSDEPVG